jgi:hypothetical protein
MVSLFCTLGSDGRHGRCQTDDLRVESGSGCFDVEYQVTVPSDWQLVGNPGAEYNGDGGDHFVLTTYWEDGGKFKCKWLTCGGGTLFGGGGWVSGYCHVDAQPVVHPFTPKLGKLVIGP